ncbi:Ig-like domain-containing protein [Chryseobacterium polytrichastri]|uniref:Por secretion system C-terminal sorting domain-containing protein n=1 Tax=Chryseobacterium polytrichastri TaxID=1302687 RepID=A0A1M6VQG5_9FLAO|nr:Ig-like domain-containing protein [Chryseobacterium polytrichastri]SHK83772.1 Por secretion system C-terminal sorting domain-containing protein [Chryseobacterium polytrichastri]
MIKQSLLFFSIMTSMMSYSQLAYLPSYSWGGNIGGTGYDIADHVTTDIYGDVVVSGKFSGNSDFDISSSANSYVSTGSSDAFVAKYSGNGSLKWMKAFASNATSDGTPYVNSMATDSSGNIYLTGHFNGSVDFDPSPTGIKMLTSNGDADIFIAKLDRNGVLVWAGSIGGIEYDRGFGITVDSLDKVYVTGSFRKTADFDITPGIFSMTSEYIDTSFILKIDKDAQFIWAKMTQGMGSDVGTSIAVDSNFNVFVTGNNKGVTDFDPSPTGVFNLSSSTGQAYLLKLDSNGNFVNAGVTTASNQSNLARSQRVKIDSNNNVLITGSFGGTVDFNFANAQNSLISFGLYGMTDAYVLKVDNNLNYLWAKSLGVQFADGADGLAIDQNNNVLATGYFEGIIVNDYSGRYGEEVFTWALDPSGNQIDLEDYIGPGSGDRGYDISVDKSGNIYTVGQFYTHLKDMTIFNYPSAGNSDGFLIKLGNAVVQQPINMPPTAVSDTFTQNGSGANTFNILANDQTLAGTTLIRIVSYPLYGTLTVNNNGTVTYTPTGLNWMNDSFSYTVENGNGLVSNVATANLIYGNLNVNEVNLDQKTKIFPNPAETSISLTSVSKILMAEVYDLSGKKMFIIKDFKTIDVSTLSPGVYVLKAETIDGQFFKKTFIKK